MDAEEAKTKQSAWNRRYTDLIKALWLDLHGITSTTSTANVSVDGDEAVALLKVAPSPADLAVLLSYGKGRRVVPRLIRFLPAEQQRILLAALIRAMAHLDVQVRRYIYPMCFLNIENDILRSRASRWTR